MTIWDVWEVLKGQRCVADPVGWGGAFFECESSFLFVELERGMER